MDSISWIWLICLCITHVCAYYLGVNDGSKKLPDEKSWEVVEMYEIDKKYEHLRWREERKKEHDI